MATNESLSITENIDNKRYYRIDKDGVLHKLPSVTTILGNMTDQSSLENWRKRIGYEEAERISRFSANRGTCMHQKLEFWFTSDIEDPKARLEDVNKKMAEFVKENGYTEDELRVGNQLFDKLYICGFFRRIDSIIEMEETLYSFDNGGYAGRVDCIYKNNSGENVLLDFKTAKHTKQKEWITNYLLQLSAYFNAYYQMTGIELDKAELWISCEIDPPQLVEISKEELKIWLKHFLRLVKGYHEKFDYLLEERKQEKTEMSENTKNLYEHLKVRSLTSNQVDDKKKPIKSKSMKPQGFDVTRFLKYNRPIPGLFSEYGLETNMGFNVQANLSNPKKNEIILVQPFMLHMDFGIVLKDINHWANYTYDVKIANNGVVYLSNATYMYMAQQYVNNGNDWIIVVCTPETFNPNEFNDKGHGPRFYQKQFSKIMHNVKSTTNGYVIDVTEFTENTGSGEEHYYGWKNDKRFNTIIDDYGVSVNEYNHIMSYVYNTLYDDSDINITEKECLDYLNKLRKAMFEYGINELHIEETRMRTFIKTLDNQFKNRK